MLQWEKRRLKRQVGGENVEQGGLCVGSRSESIRAAGDKSLKKVSLKANNSSLKFRLE